VFKYESKITVFEGNAFAFSFEKERGFDLRYGFGVSQNITEMLVVNSGFLSNPSQFSAGVVIKMNKKEIGYGLRTHDELDWTHAVGVGYRW
jgi:hypothetical protein